VTARSTDRPELGGETSGSSATVPEAVREIEEVVPVNASTWVLLEGVTVGR
jgi:hypothetical protein